MKYEIENTSYSRVKLKDLEEGQMFKVINSTYYIKGAQLSNSSRCYVYCINSNQPEEWHDVASVTPVKYKLIIEDKID